MSGTVTDLTDDGREIITGKDNVVIKKVLETIRGGKSLDLTGYAPGQKVINAGHVIIKETATGILKPMPLNTDEDAYAALPGGHTYAYIQIQTVRRARPMVGLLVRGSVNPNATPFDMTAILAAVKTAMPLITFLAD